MVVKGQVKGRRRERYEELDGEKEAEEENSGWATLRSIQAGMVEWRGSQRLPSPLKCREVPSGQPAVARGRSDCLQGTTPWALPLTGGRHPPVAPSSEHRLGATGRVGGPLDAISAPWAPG